MSEMICFRTAGRQEKELLWNIYQKYRYEMSGYYGDFMDEAGNYPSRYFEAYFSDPKRCALLFYHQEKLIGFAMIHPYASVDSGAGHVLAEFTIFPMYRNRKLGQKAAQKIFETRRGKWEIKYHERNAGAKAFWNRLSEPFHPERIPCGEEETVLVFTI